jgi:hypothetical protein
MYSYAHAFCFSFKDPTEIHDLKLFVKNTWFRSNYRVQIKIGRIRRGIPA